MTISVYAYAVGCDSCHVRDYGHYVQHPSKLIEERSKQPSNCACYRTTGQHPFAHVHHARKMTHSEEGTVAWYVWHPQRSMLMKNQAFQLTVSKWNATHFAQVLEDLATGINLPTGWCRRGLCYCVSDFSFLLHCCPSFLLHFCQFVLWNSW